MYHIANFEAFCKGISSSINLLFLKSVYYLHDSCKSHGFLDPISLRCVAHLRHFTENFLLTLRIFPKFINSHVQNSIDEWISCLLLMVWLILWRFGVKVRNSKMDFNIYDTWRWVTFENLMMKIYDFFYSAKSFSHPI